tara:strand:+ start:4498 stop:5376 length:879 start_codon:yes stop_codon:yes gene_type:complete
MSRGFITLGIDTDEDKIKHCYTLACSLKIIEPTAEICLVVDKGRLDMISDYYSHVFDYIVELPYGNSAYKDGFHGMNLWQLYHCTPFDETIYLDYDTILVNVDLDTLWELMATNDISFPGNANNYRGFSANQNLRFEYEIQYKLPKLYYNVIYWKQKSALAIEWFKMADPVLQYWRDVYSKVFTDKKPQDFEKNVLCNLVTHFLDLELDTRIFLNNHTDLHRFSHGIFDEDVPDRWTEFMNTWVTNHQKIQIENYILPSGIIHYSDETFLTDEVMHVYRTKFITDSKKRKST